MTEEREPTAEVVRTTLAEHMEHAASAISLYEILGLTNEESVKVIAELVRPPHKLERPTDLAYPGVRDYYARFVTLADAATPGARPFEAARYVYGITMPIAEVLDGMLDNYPVSAFNASFVEYATTVLPELAEHIRSGKIYIEQ